MDAAQQRIRAQLAQWQAPTWAPLTTAELQEIYLEGNERGPLGPDPSRNTIVNLVNAEDRWRKFCEGFKDSRGRDWMGLLRALQWTEKGLIDAFARWFMRRRGARIRALSTPRRYLRDVSALYFRYTGDQLDTRVRRHMLQVALQELGPQFGLRTEPKRKNIMGPRGFTYLVHYTWARSRKPFKIGLDRIDHVFCRMILMWTGCRSHELVWGTRNIENYLQRYHARRDAFAKPRNGSDKYMEKIPKTCWVCNRVDDRTLPQHKVLCWEDITIHILPDPQNNGGRDMFAMDILLRFHKGHENETVPTVYHFIEDPYALLCPIVYILGKAFSEKVIDFEALDMDVSGLDLLAIITNLFNTKLPGSSLYIPLKEEYWHTPVFRRTEFAADGRPHKSNKPITKSMLDNDGKREGQEAGLPDDVLTYDFRRGNLEVLDTNYRESVRNRGARHRPGTNVYETSYVGQGMTAITQDAFLGRGTHSPLTDILNHIGLRYDENAPTQVTDEMLRLAGPDEDVLRLEKESSDLQKELEAKYGKPSLATGLEKKRYASLQNQLKVAKQRHSRRVFNICRKDYFITENNKKLGQQLRGERELTRAEEIKPVYLTVPERRKLAAIFGNFDEEPSEEHHIRNKINAVVALTEYAWVVEREDQAVLVEATEPKVVDKAGTQRPWFASMIRDPARSENQEAKCGEGKVGLDISASKLPTKGAFTCMFCKKSKKRNATMWNCVDRHIAGLMRDTGAVKCPHADCERRDAFENEMFFKHHADQDHNIQLRPPQLAYSTVPDPLCSLGDGGCPPDTGPIVSISSAMSTRNMAQSSALNQSVLGTEALEAGELMSPYPELPDTLDAKGYPGQQPVSLDCYREVDTLMPPIEDISLWAQSPRGSQCNFDDLKAYGQSEAGWSGSVPEPQYNGSDMVEDAGGSQMWTEPCAHLQASSTMMELDQDLSDADLLDPALKGHDGPEAATPESQDIEMLEGASNDDDVEYPVEALLEKRGKMFYIQWKDGSRSWEPRDQISDDLVAPFESSWKGYHLGIDVLYRKPAGRACFRVRFKDWPWGNATIWVATQDLSPALRAQWLTKAKRRAAGRSIR